MGTITRLLAKVFRVQTIHPDPLSRAHDQFNITRIPFLFYHASNARQVAGHIRLFGDRPMKGWTIHTYHQLMDGWALERHWNFGLFCVHHIGEGDSTYDRGWHITWASLKFQFVKPDLYRAQRRRDEKAAQERVDQMRKKFHGTNLCREIELP